MSVRRHTQPVATSTMPNAPARSGSGRLSAVLKLGAEFCAKYNDENGHLVRYVEFEPNDPKSSSIQRNCIGVPWKYSVYDSKDLPIVTFSRDVTADPRLKNIGLGGVFDDAVSATQDRVVQSYATKRRNSMAIDPFIPAGIGLWVMEFNSDEDDFARYCLVPIDVRTIEERLERAIHHLQTYISDEAIERYDNSFESVVAFRRFYVSHWTRAYDMLNKM